MDNSTKTLIIVYMKIIRSFKEEIIKVAKYCQKIGSNKISSGMNKLLEKMEEFFTFCKLTYDECVNILINEEKGIFDEKEIRLTIIDIFNTEVNLNILLEITEGLLKVGGDEDLISTKDILFIKKITTSLINKIE